MHCWLQTSVYLVMNQSGMPGVQSAVQPTALNPVTFEEYIKREAELLSLLSSNGSGESINKSLLPNNFSLHQNYPNPFNPTTIINYDLPELSDVKIEVFNILGQNVITLVNKIEQPGFKF